MQAQAGFSANMRDAARAVVDALRGSYAGVMQAMSPQNGDTLQRLTLSYRYNSVIVGSLMFLVMTGLFAADMIGFLFIWNRPLLNALAWTIVGGIAWSMMYLSSFLNEVTGYARALSEDTFNMVTGGDLLHGSHVAKRLSVLAGASIDERRWIYAHMWATTALYVIGLGYLWRWWAKYRVLGHISMISNGIVLIEWQTVVTVLGTLTIPFLFLTLAALSAYQISFHHTFWSAVGLLGRRYGVTTANKAA